MKWHSIKRSSIISNLFVIFWCSLSQCGATHGTETHWSRAQQWGLVWSQSRGACEEVNSMEKLIFSHLAAVPPECMSWSSLLPTTGQPWGRWWHSLCFCFPLERADEETQFCLECCAEEMPMDFRFLTVGFSHHQGCGEGSCWITEGQSFWWINHKFIHMPRAFLMATVSQPGMLLRNGGPAVITCGMLHQMHLWLPLWGRKIPWAVF